MIAALYFDNTCELTEEQVMEGLRKIGDVPEEGERIHLVQIDQDPRRILAMDPSLRVVDRVHAVMFALEKYMEERRLVNRFRPDGSWDKEIGRAVGGWMIKGIKPYSFHTRVKIALKCEKDSDKPEVIQRITLEVANEIKREQRNRALRLR